MSDDFRIDSKIAKVDEDLGLVIGYAVVCKDGGEDYFDLQGDHIPEDAMLKAWLDFAENSRVAGEMHKSAERRGTVVGSFPMTSDIAKSLGIETERTGLLIAMKPDDDMLGKFKDGTLTGFSIGGARLRDEEVSGEA